MALDPVSSFRWGVIGPGGIANRFAGALPAVPGARLSWVFAREAAKGQAYAAQWQRDGEAPARVTTVLDELLHSDEVDAVYIATPHSHHGEYVRAALLAGKPVLCEKPLVTTQRSALPDGSGTTVKCRNYKGMTVEMPGLGVNFSLPSHSN